MTTTTTEAPAPVEALAAADRLAAAVKTAQSALSGSTREWAAALFEVFTEAENYQRVRKEAASDEPA